MYIFFHNLYFHNKILNFLCVTLGTFHFHGVYVFLICCRKPAKIGEETAVEEAAINTVVMSLESYARLKTPTTGELELSMDCKKRLLPPADGTVLDINRVDTDVSIIASFCFRFL